MSKVKLIHTNFILEVQHEGIEYHVTISEDLKDIYDIDILNVNEYSNKYKKVLQSTAMCELIWEAFMTHELNLDI